jgi:hypothetical protein
VIIKAKVGGQRDERTVPQILPLCLRDRIFPGDFESNACMIASQGTVVTIDSELELLREVRISMRCEAAGANSTKE